jgi:hypothetical protein
MTGSIGRSRDHHPPPCVNGSGVGKELIMKSNKSGTKTKSEPSSAIPLLPEELWALFKIPALLPNEDPARYQELFNQVVAAILPTNAVEMMFAEDLAAYTLAIDRYRRFGAAILMAGQKDATADFLGMIADKGDFKGVNRRQTGLAEAHVSMSGTPEDREYVRLKLRRFGVTFDGICANAFTENQGVLERFDRLKAEAVKRRYDCLRELDRYRKSLGDRVRRVIEAVEMQKMETPVDVDTHPEHVIPAEMDALGEPEVPRETPINAALPVDEELPVAEEELHVAEELIDEPDTGEED